MFRKPSCLFRRSRYFLACARSHIANCRDQWLDPRAYSFFKALNDGGYKPDAHIDVLPQHRLLYVCVPKCASTTIKAVLSELNGRAAVPPKRLHSRRHTGLLPPAQVGLSDFYRLAISPDTLRFAFVRNPYARLVSAWADKFQNRPLVPGNSFIDLYLAHRAATDRPLSAGREQTLSFAQFIEFAVTTSDRRIDAHWQLQDDLISMPGIALDFVGTVETFNEDFRRVLDHVGAHRRLREAISVHHNASCHYPWQDYYTDRLAARVYRAYERDFSRFGYPRGLGSQATR